MKLDLSPRTLIIASFPEGPIHYQKNIGKSHVVAIGALNSQNPGVTTIAKVVFGSNPSIPGDILAKAFPVNKKLIPAVHNPRFKGSIYILSTSVKIHTVLLIIDSLIHKTIMLVLV